MFDFIVILVQYVGILLQVPYVIVIVYIGLEYDLKSNVFGQPFAIDIILGALKHHLQKNKPDRALMLSFHGGPGTGKNFISQKIVDNMFKNGKDSRYVHTFKSSIDFPEKSRVGEYKV